MVRSFKKVDDIQEVVVLLLLLLLLLQWYCTAGLFPDLHGVQIFPFGRICTATDKISIK
jgi:hypothetical protein